MGFEEEAEPYLAGPQRARVWTEGWVGRWLYCINCGADRLEKQPNNAPASDFVCGTCRETFELKSQRRGFGRKVRDGAFRSMLERVNSATNPNLLLLSYDTSARTVQNVWVVPKQFLTAASLEQCPPLKAHARRAGHVMCNILLHTIPAAGRVSVVKDGVVRTHATVRSEWRRTLFLRDTDNDARGWMIEVMRIVERFGARDFTLAEVYAHEAHLSTLYPDNNNVRAKIRQQLQVLRDFGFLTFLGGGVYRLKGAQ